MTAPGDGLEARLHDLEQAVRSLMTTNWTDRASVVDASGNAVPLSSLAFGQVAAFVNGYFTLAGPGAGGSGLVNGADFTPAVTVYVSGGRLRVDWSAELDSSTAGGNSAVLSMTVTAQGPYPDAATAAAAPVGLGALAGGGTFGSALPYRYSTPVYLTADAEGAAGVVNIAAGTFALLTGLPKGYYRVYPTYSFSYDATNNAAVQPSGLVRRRTVAAQPF